MVEDMVRGEIDKAIRLFLARMSIKELADEELFQIVKEREAKRVTDPNYTPTLEQAMRHPKEFVDGFTEVK